jgi:excisionase family DNA binding protein
MEAPIPFLSPEDVAERLGLNVRTIRRYIREGRLKATRIGKQYRVAANDFQAFVGSDQPTSTSTFALRKRRVIVSATADIHAISSNETERIIAVLSGAFTTKLNALWPETLRS